jgi:hypothetical protein
MMGRIRRIYKSIRTIPTYIYCIVILDQLHPYNNDIIHFIVPKPVIPRLNNNM